MLWLFDCQGLSFLFLSFSAVSDLLSIAIEFLDLSIYSGEDRVNTDGACNASNVKIKQKKKGCHKK